MYSQIIGLSVLIVFSGATGVWAQARAYVANNASGNVSVIDTSTNSVVATVTVGSNPLSLGDFVGPGPIPVELQSFGVR